MPFVKVEGADRKRNIRLYALSTCGWCRKTRELLDRLGVTYEYVYVDECDGDERAQMTTALKGLNPRCSFPTVKIDDEVIVGFDDEGILELLGQ